MKNAFIIHGAEGNPQGNWFPWLRTELERTDYEVVIPTFPTPQNQNLTNWLEVIKPYISEMNEETILIGHSIGATFVLDILEQLTQPVLASFLVSVFVQDLSIEFFDNINRSFYQKEFDWDKIKNGSKLFYLFHGNNDQYVPLNLAEEVAQKLHAKIDIIENGGHLNSEAGFTQFPQLLETITNISKIRNQSV